MLVLRFAFPLLHVIDGSSPLNGLELEQLEAEEAEIVVTMTGTDEVSGQRVFSRNAMGSTGWCIIIASSISSTRPQTAGLPSTTRFHETGH
ncbi:hypothetical protein [Gluconacetobacter azotocaptans]|uniref:hypothetical protein n=1 Tax=Gluconacetobacter azotocaptans TaxID=142834 RepID=UPI0022323297|nr:hypothetical protein [Gluconacetobacter azotocaptans]